MDYFLQLQDFDFAKEWESLKAPIRIRWGTNDWIMSEFDNNMIVDVLDRNKHVDHKLYKYPGLDHWSTIHESALNSFNGKPGKWEDKISQQFTPAHRVHSDNVHRNSIIININTEFTLYMD